MTALKYWDAASSTWKVITGLASDGGVPIGTITAWGGAANAVPTGWQLCDGSAALSGPLIALVGANVPDLRDRFIVGVSGTKVKGATGGAETVTLTAAQSGLPDHTHALELGGAPGTGGTADVATRTAVRGDGQFRTGYATASTAYGSAAVGNTPASQAHNNMPPYYALAWIIKHTGAGATGLTAAEADARYGGVATAWTDLPLGASFTAYGGGYGTPQYRMLGNGNVQLRGLAKTTGAIADGAVIGTLPVGFRPAAQTVHNVFGSFGNMSAQVFTDGTVHLYAGAPATGAYVSLDDVEFYSGGTVTVGAVAYTKTESDARYTPTPVWTPFAYSNTGANYAGTYGVATGWWKDPQGFVQLQGLVAFSTALAASAAILTLPAGARPSGGTAERIFTCPSADGATQTAREWRISPAGVLSPAAAFTQTNNWVSVSGIRFHAG